MKRRLAQPGAVALIALAAVLAGAQIATATIPDANGTVHGCVNQQKGQLYVIDPSAGDTCGKKDTALDWNKTGETGVQGAPGPKGVPGFQGTAGISGYEKMSVTEPTDSTGNGRAEADCSSGKVALAGGYELSSKSIPLHSAPTSDGSGWVVDVTAGALNSTITAFAICATNGGS